MTPPSPEPSPDAPSSAAATSTTFAVVGDFGSGDDHEAAVADMVSSWGPEFIIGLGDLYYSEAGGNGSALYDASVGRYYCQWLKDISTSGHNCPVGLAQRNAFFATLGNHDLSDAKPAPGSYLDYFTLPGSGFQNTSGNERYYDFVMGPIHFFVLNSNQDEPDGTSSASAQGTWLRTQLAQSVAPWNVVVDHHPPFSSDNSHGSAEWMQWPFARWGADIVLSGHAHTYERIERDGIVYFVNGLGGADLYDFSDTPVSGSALRFRDEWAAQFVTATSSDIRLELRTVSGAIIDEHILHQQ